MDENRIVELLTRKIAGEASAEELGELSYLLARFPDAVYYEALLEQVWDLGAGSERERLHEAFRRHKNRYREELKFKTPAKARLSFIKKPAFFVGAFAFALLLSLAYTFSFQQKPHSATTVEVLTARGVRKEVKLPDGTFVRLNSDSRITYDPQMLKNDIREVRLTGEAYFDVAHDAKHAFIVQTNKITVKVLGTEFNIKEYPGEKTSETTLLKGAIELSVSGRSDQKFVLKPSEKFALTEKKNKDVERSNVLTIENISPVRLGDQEYIREITWVDNKLIFQNESFEELRPKLERWYNVKIRIEDPEIRSFRFTGIFVDEDIIQAMQAMQLIKPFHYNLTANEIEIY